MPHLAFIYILANTIWCTSKKTKHSIECSSGMTTLFNRQNPAHHWQPCAMSKLMFTFSGKQTLVQKDSRRFPKKHWTSQEMGKHLSVLYPRPWGHWMNYFWHFSFVLSSKETQWLKNAFNQSRWRLFPQTPAEGASITVYAAAASEMEGVGGCYLYNGEKRESSESSYDAELQAKLWKTSCELVGIKSPWRASSRGAHPTVTKLCLVDIPKHPQRSPRPPCQVCQVSGYYCAWSTLKSNLTRFLWAPIGLQFDDYIDPYTVVNCKKQRRKVEGSVCLFVLRMKCALFIYLVQDKMFTECVVPLFLMSRYGKK